jgi:RND family efflux transporter MFP subunit
MSCGAIFSTALAVLTLSAAGSAQAAAGNTVAIQPASSAASASASVNTGIAGAKGAYVSVRGTVEAERHAVISSELAARIVSLPRRDGESFRKGDIIVGLDCALYQAQLASARADLSIATQTLASNRELEKRSAVSPFAVAISAAEQQRAAANVQSADINVSHCQIRAPYDGSVVAALANENETVAPGSQLISIIDTGSVHIRLAMPSDTMQWIKPGIPFEFKTDESTERVPAAIAIVGAHIDLVNHSVLVIGLPSSRHKLLSGMNGTATFAVRPR